MLEGWKFSDKKVSSHPRPALLAVLHFENISSFSSAFVSIESKLIQIYSNLNLNLMWFITGHISRCGARSSGTCCPPCPRTSPWSAAPGTGPLLTGTGPSFVRCRPLLCARNRPLLGQLRQVQAPWYRPPSSGTGPLNQNRPPSSGAGPIRQV